MFVPDKIDRNPLISSGRMSQEKPLEPLEEKNFMERLDSIEKMINTWSSRGLSIYEKVTITNSLLNPKFGCFVSINQLQRLSEVNSFLFKFLWNGADKITCHELQQ